MTAQLTVILLFALVAFTSAYLVIENISEEDYPPRSERTSEEAPQENPPQKSQPLKEFYEVDAFGPHFTDFGAQTGDNGAFTWHANFPIRTRGQLRKVNRKQ